MTAKMFIISLIAILLSSSNAQRFNENSIDRLAQNMSNLPPIQCSVRGLSIVNGSVVGDTQATVTRGSVNCMSTGPGFCIRVTATTRMQNNARRMGLCWKGANVFFYSSDFSRLALREHAGRESALSGHVQ